VAETVTAGRTGGTKVAYSVAVAVIVVVVTSWFSTSRRRGFANTLSADKRGTRDRSFMFANLEI
jgi:hypothetical protein